MRSLGIVGIDNIAMENYPKGNNGATKHQNQKIKEKDRRNL
jgi:hypothetical protein